MQVFKAQGMSCGHCVRAITQALQALDAAARVEVDLSSSEVHVDSVLSAEEVLAALGEEGYEASLVP